MANIRDDFKVFDEYRLGRLDNDNIRITLPNAESSNNKTPSQFTFVAPKPVYKHEGDQDMDAKTIGFDDLLVQVESKTLLSILHKVYNYICSGDDDLEFPNISDKIEEVLVRIVQNVEVLGSPRMYSTCKRVSNLIMETMKSKAENKVFIVVCVYKEPKSPLLKGLGVENDNILVYKKLYFTQMKEKDKFSSMSSLSSTPPLSRSTSVSSLDSQRSLTLEKLYKMKTPMNDEVAEEQKVPKRFMKKSVMKLKQLLSNLPSDFIEHSLEKLKNFFSDDREATVVFSMMAGSKKIFLKHCLNYCRSPVLKPEFPENQRKLLDELSVLVDNKTGYKIKIKDKKKACGEKELIFMKIPQFDKPANNSRPCSLSSTPSLSRSSSVSSLNSQRSHITLPSEMHFKAHCLHLILKFIKDHNQPNLEFSGLTPDEAEYIHTVFSNLINNTFDEVLGQTSVCVAIREAVKIFALKYEFRIRYLESNGGMMSLMLEKLYKMKGTKNDEVAEEQKVPKRFMKKSVMKLKQLLSNLPSDFIEHSLEKLKNFFSDDREATVVFSMMAGSKKTFLKHCLNYCRSPVLKPEFPENQRKLLDELSVLVDNKTGYKIRIKDKKKACGEKELIFTKIPQFDKPAKNSRPWYPPLQPPRRKAPGMSSAKRKELAQKVPGFQMSRTAAFCQSWANQYRLQASRNSTKPNKKDVKLGPNINFQSGGILNQMVRNENSSILESERDPTLVGVMRQYDMDIKDLPRTSAPAFSSRLKTGPELTARPGTIVNRGKAMRTVQLIEALSVPVKCDKAMRMMVGMGWNGGALGTRGQGIMEPLMPHLTGLGVPPKPLAEPRPRYPAAVPTLTVSNNKRTSAKFRRMFLEQLLELLTSRCDSKTLQLHPMLNKKEKSFLRHAMRTFAARAKLSIADEEQQLVEKVSEQYANDADLVVSACISDDKKQIVLTKIHSPAMPLYLNERPRPKNIMKNMVNMVITDNIQDLLDSCGSLCQSQKSMESTRFRVAILMEVLNLIKDESKNYLELKFDQTLTMKQRNFIELSVQSVNNRTKFGCSSPEVAISMEIKRLLGDYKLRVKFAPDFKSITVIKVYNVKTTEKKAKAAETTETDTTENNNKRKHNKKENNKNVKIDLNESDIIVEEYVEFIENAIKEANNEIMNQDEIDKNLTIENDIKIYDKDRQPLKYDPMANTSQDDTPKGNISENIEVSNNQESNKKFKMADNIDENMNTVSKTPVSDEDLTDNESDDKQDMSESTNDNTNDRSFMSISDHSAYTINLDYTETDDIEDISMAEAKNGEEKLSDNEELNVTCDKPLELSFKSETMLNIDFENKPQIIENSKIDVKIVFLTKSFFFSKDMPKYIQGLISLNIVQTKELPLLKCHGVQNGALIYSCHTKKSYDWLQSICVANNINMVIKEFDKMCLKVNSYFEFDDDYIFSMLEMYNKKLSTKEWRISKKSFMGDCILCEVRMDKDSFKFIVDSDLSLYAGVDKITFSIIWE